MAFSNEETFFLPANGQNSPEGVAPFSAQSVEAFKRRSAKDFVGLGKKESSIQSPRSEATPVGHPDDGHHALALALLYVRRHGLQIVPKTWVTHCLLKFERL